MSSKCLPLKNTFVNQFHFLWQSSTPKYFGVTYNKYSMSKQKTENQKTQQTKSPQNHQANFVELKDSHYILQKLKKYIHLAVLYLCQIYNKTSTCCSWNIIEKEALILWEYFVKGKEINKLANIS